MARFLYLCTQLPDYLRPLFVFCYYFMLLEFRAWGQTWSQESLRNFEPYAKPLLISLILYLVLLLVLFMRGYWIAPIVLTLIIAAGLLGLRPGIDPARRIVLILISAALGLTLLVEIVVLDGDIGRMNTVFKFYMQVWIILSVAAGAAAVWSWEKIRKRQSARKVWQAVLIFLVFLAAPLSPLGYAGQMARAHEPGSTKHIGWHGIYELCAIW